MRARGTWNALFFFLASLVVAAAFNYAFRDIFSWMQVDNRAILGDNFRLSTLIAVSIAAILGVFFGVFFEKSKRYVDQCVVEFYKVAFPMWKETKSATFIVVVVSVIASIFLSIFDSVFSWWTNNNLFIW